MPVNCNGTMENNDFQASDISRGYGAANFKQIFTRNHTIGAVRLPSTYRRTNLALQQVNNIQNLPRQFLDECCKKLGTHVLTGHEHSPNELKHSCKITSFTKATLTSSRCFC